MRRKTSNPVFSGGRSFGQAVRVLRLKRHLTQEELRQLIASQSREEISQAYISRIENGEGNVTMAKLTGICRALECSPADLYSVAEMISKKGRVGRTETLVDALRKPKLGLDDRFIDELCETIVTPSIDNVELMDVIDSISEMVRQSNENVLTGRQLDDARQQIARLHELLANENEPFLRLVKLVDQMFHVIVARTSGEYMNQFASHLA